MGEQCKPNKCEISIAWKKTKLFGEIDMIAIDMLSGGSMAMTNSNIRMATTLRNKKNELNIQKTMVYNLEEKNEIESFIREIDQRLKRISGQTARCVRSDTDALVMNAVFKSFLCF